jgi:hypothetical protein
MRWVWQVKRLSSSHNWLCCMKLVRFPSFIVISAFHSRNLTLLLNISIRQRFTCKVPLSNDNRLRSLTARPKRRELTSLVMIHAARSHSEVAKVRVLHIHWSLRLLQSSPMFNTSLHSLEVCTEEVNHWLQPWYPGMPAASRQNIHSLPRTKILFIHWRLLLYAASFYYCNFTRTTVHIYFHNTLQAAANYTQLLT